MDLYAEDHDDARIAGAFDAGDDNLRGVATDGGLRAAPAHAFDPQLQLSHPTHLLKRAFESSQVSDGMFDEDESPSTSVMSLNTPSSWPYSNTQHSSLPNTQVEDEEDSADDNALGPSVSNLSLLSGVTSDPGAVATGAIDGSRDDNDDSDDSNDTASTVPNNEAFQLLQQRRAMEDQVITSCTATRRRLSSCLAASNQQCDSPASADDKIDLKAKFGMCPLDVAVIFDRPDHVRKIISDNPGSLLNYASDGFTPMHRAALRGSVLALVTMLDCSANMEVQSKTNSKSTPLLIACAAGQPACVKVLLARGANPLALTSAKWNAMHAASQVQNVETVWALLDHVNCAHELCTAKTGDQNLTAYEIALRGRNMEVAREILGHVAYTRELESRLARERLVSTQKRQKLL